MLKDSLAVIGLSWSLDLPRSGTELTIANQMDLGIELMRKCCWFFAGTEHPVFRGTSALERGELRSKEGGKKSIHFNGSTQKHWFASTNGHLCQSAQYLRSSSGYDWRIASWSESSGSWHEFTFHEEPYLALSGTIIWRNKKTDLWTVRNPWSRNTRDRGSENNWIRRKYMEVDKLIVQRSLSDHYCQSLCLLRLSQVTQTRLGWVKSNGIRRTTTSRNWTASMACRRSSSGKSSQDSRRWASSKRFKILWKENSVNLSTSMVESSSCQCLMTLYGENGNTEDCIQNSMKVSEYARRFPCGRWSFLGLGSEKKWYKTCSDKPNGNCDRTAEMMIPH